MEKEILFEYRSGNASDCAEGDDDGFSFIIYKDGSATYSTYIVSNITKKHKIFKVSEQTVKEITSIIDKNKKEISTLDKDIDNGSDDGDFNDFTFGNKTIFTLNIEENDIKMIKLNNPRYFIEYYHVMLQENIIMKIFKEICAILRKNHAIRLDLCSAKIPIWLFINRIKLK